MKIEIEGITIDYTMEGSGRDVLLLHGWGCTKETLKVIADELKKTMRVTAIDFPGFGNSSLPGEEYGVPEYAQLTAKLIEELGIAGTDIVCHSFGGRVATVLAATRPELVGKIVFTGAAGLKKKRSLGYHLKVYRYKLFKKAAKSAAMKKFFGIFGVDVDEKIKNAGSSDYQALSGVMRTVFVRVVNQDLKGYLKDIQSPSLLIFGENDQETPVEFGKIMEKNIPDAGLVVLKNAGHYAFLDQCYAFLKIVTNFLEV